MDLTLLGTGSAVPTGDRYQTGIVVEAASRTDPLLIDCGAGTIHRLTQAGFDITRFDTVLLTHHHLDHVADLPSLLKARWLQDASTCTIIGPFGTREYLSAFLDIDQLLERVDVTFRECDSSEFTLCGFDIKTCETAHSAAGFAYRIDGEFTFSGDTEASESVARFADGSSVLVHDCAYYDEEETNHATPHQLGQTIAGVDIDDLYLTHFYPDAAANADAMRRIVREYVTATVHIPADLETIQIQASE